MIIIVIIKTVVHHYDKKIYIFIDRTNIQKFPEIQRPYQKQVNLMNNDPVRSATNLTSCH